jgi:hypothetical protein
MIGFMETLVQDSHALRVDYLEFATGPALVANDRIGENAIRLTYVPA